MASDIATTIEDDSRPKHRRSPDKEVQEPSKRRKHRHHHRSRHHRHHRSKKHEENKNEEEEVDRGEGDDADPSVLAPSTVLEDNLKPDYDMEEGEIVDDADRQIEPAEENLSVDAKGVSSYLASQEVGHITNQPLESNGRESGRTSKTVEVHTSNGEFQSDSVSEKKGGMKFQIGKSVKSKDQSSSRNSITDPHMIHANGDFSWESSKKCNTFARSVGDGSGHEKVDSTRRSLSHDCVDDRPRLKSIDKEVSLIENSLDIMDVDREVERCMEFQRGNTGVGKDNTSSDRHTDAWDKNHIARSPNRKKREADMERGGERDRDMGMDKDRRRDRGRERSRDGEKELQRKARGGDREKRGADWDQDSEKEQDRGMNMDRRKDRDRDRDREIEIQRRSRGGDGGRGEFDRDQDRRKDRDRETSRDREKELLRRTRHVDGQRMEVDWDRGSRKQRDRSIDIDTVRDRDRKTSRDIETPIESRIREMEQGKSRDEVKDRERSKERDISRELVREKERGRSRGNEIDLNRREVKERDRRSRDIGIDSDIRESRRDRSRDRDRERDRERERGRDKERDRDREFSRIREKDSERDNNRRKGGGDRDGYTNYRYGAIEDHHDWTRRNKPEKFHNSKLDSVKVVEDKWTRDEDEQEDYQEKISLQLEDQEEEDIEKIKEESRRISQAILEKYKSKQTQQQTSPPSSSADKGKSDQLTSDVTTAPEKFDARNSGDNVYVGDSSFSVGKSPPQNDQPVPERSSGAGGLGEGTPKSEMSNDMFCDDIFGDSPAGVRKMAKGDGLPSEKSGMHDNWDDAEGYYSYRFGEVLDGRYEITAAHGKGVFSNVVRAKDFKDGNSEPEEVAIKIIRNNETMYKSGQSELIILKKLVGADPENKRHCVRFLSSFKYRNHLCLVFESLHMNLREVLKKFGRNIGLKLTAVRAYAKQLFIALKHLKNCGVLHCDIKPDNMLVNDAKNVLKLCDFGSAMFAGKNEITPYLVSRFYRAPEIILGLPYDHPLDMWSVGCCLYELYTGKVLFPGSTNSDMLRLHMELKGPFPKKMLRKGGFLEQHFDQDLNFLATEEDPVTKKSIRRMMNNIKAKDIGTIIASSPGEDPKMAVNFKDLLDKMFVLDPDKRLTVSQALSHPFISGK